MAERESVSVYYAQGRYWGYTQTQINEVGGLPSCMSFIFAITQKEGETVSDLKLRVQKEGRALGINHIANL